ncbi:hypothetical protein ACIPYS_06270 [Kitasatospora sp. NPDC089913]|uniref:hypothetical protein n=1 Tax=Streptomycetaceae TaxID=2062 RepID=UPI00087B59FE|nr:hypothetical protein [Streptomyces sp. TLI_053]SDT81493.1 hypothetical protein SAMN05216371_6671 [Streptomyces sp. TLI_053]
MGDEDKDSGGHGVTKITEGYVAEFADKKLQNFINGLTSSANLRDIALYATDGGMVSANRPSHLLLGNSSATAPSIGALTTAFKGYFGSVNAGFNTINTQVKNMKQDLKDADLILQNGEEDAISVAELMYLLNNVVPGGGSGTGPR